MNVCGMWNWQIVQNICVAVSGNGNYMENVAQVLIYSYAGLNYGRCLVSSLNSPLEHGSLIC